ncbi:MAG: tetratricopeptide repeat protein [Nitrospinae bacterium]|nr:tetratricopeptide repeat protein [Nitrospinota bacterium]
MTISLIDAAIELMKRRLYAEALDIFRQVIAQNSSHWNVWYMAGQCYRFLGDLDNAIKCLSRSVDLKGDEPPVFLALGIVFQLKERWDDAVNAFRRAIETDPDYVLAYNSLALTQKKRADSDDFDKALHNYDAGAMALARQIIKVMRNNRNNPILKHRETVGELWVKYALYAASYLASTETGNIDALAWPTGEQAFEEERTEKHAGLYWTDNVNTEGKTVRLFLSNYFNTFRESLLRDATYSTLMLNRGEIFRLLDQHDESRQHIDEADEFRPSSI